MSLRKKVLGNDKGLGDTIERFTKLTGIKNIVDKLSEFTGKDCQCKKRKDKLNRLFSYNKLKVEEKQMVDNMFGTTCDSSTTTCPTSGTATVEGAQIYWVKDTSTEIITLTITDVDGTTTTMTVPLGDFKF